MQSDEDKKRKREEIKIKKVNNNINCKYGKNCKYGENCKHNNLYQIRKKKKDNDEKEIFKIKN